MNQGRTIFSQIVDLLPKRDFHRCVKKYEGNKGHRTFSCWDQFLCLAFAQITYRESLRDIETCLRAIGSKLFHLGIKARVSRSTLADANNKRSWLIYYEFAQIVIRRAQELYAGSEEGSDKSSELYGVAYCLDASVIDLCLSLFPWAHYTSQWANGRAAIKLHTLLNLETKIPSFFTITPCKTHELSILDILTLEAGAFYIMDRGYFDWSRLLHIHNCAAFFVIRAKKHMALQRLYSLKISRKAKEASIKSDHVVTHIAKKVARSRLYPEKLRRIRYYDVENKKNLIFITNNFQLQSETIAQLYKQRWQVELFFKWVKQHLRIKAFYGTTENAVKTQLSVAITVYALIAIVKKTLGLQLGLYSVLQILSITALEKTPIFAGLFNKSHSKNSENIQNQLILPIFDAF